MNFQRTTWLIIPAVGAVAIFQTVSGPWLTVNGVRPDLVLLIVIARSLLAGRRDGTLWGFVGGLWLDIFSGGPMGASSLALMAVALLTGVGHNAVFRRNLFVPLIATLLGSGVFSLIYMAILAMVGYRFPADLLFTEVVGPVLLYNGILMFLATPLLNRIPEQTEFA